MYMRKQFYCAAIFALLLGSTAGAADLEAGKVIVLQGNGKASTACVACHGAQGAGNAQASFPQLARLNTDYLAKQLRDFQRGTRKDAVMQPIAKALSEKDIADVSAYFAVQRPPAPTTTADTKLLTRGELLAVSGFWDKAVPACVSCHGPAGRGVGANFPALAGQHASYIAKQLNAWRSGTRANDPQGLMKGIAVRLPASDISAVSAYLASLPSAP